MSMIFSHLTTMSAHKPASFWREKHDTVVILQGFPKMLWCQNKSRTQLQVWRFQSAKRLNYQQ